MRSPPEDDSEHADLKRLNVEQWMVEYLDLNVGYVHWGPGEDFMETRGEGWSTSLEIEGWTAFGPWAINDLNQCVAFYFELMRESDNCDACGQSGYNRATHQIAEDFYDFERTGRRWCDRITQDECDALVTAGRLRRLEQRPCGTEPDGRDWEWVVVPRTAAEVNEANARRGRGLPHGSSGDSLDHDAINRGILVEARAKRLGVWGMCPKCDGHGYVFTQPAGQLNVVLWVIHPRKGCSRGVRVKALSRDDAEAAKQWLATAAAANADRFARVR